MPQSPEEPVPQVTLRPWRDEDLPLYVEMNADPVVMEYFPSTYSFEETKESYWRQRTRIKREGWGLWAVDVDGDFAGFTGLAVPVFPAPFMPCVEIGWRLRKEFWGRGVALAAARQAEAFAFDRLKLERLHSFTAVQNVRSWRLMEKLGMERVKDGEFLHPRIPCDHPLQLHVLYCKHRRQYDARGK